MNRRLLLRNLLVLCALLLSLTASAQVYFVSGQPPAQASRCGPVFEVPITFRAFIGNDTTGTTAVLNLPQGVYINSVDPDTSYMNDTIFVPPLGTNGTFTTTFTMQVGCDFVGQTFRLILDMANQPDVRLPTVEVIQADLSMPTANPATFGVYRGLVDSISARVVNASFGNLDSFSYCVVNNHPAVAIRKTSLGGVELPFAYVQDDKNCYTVTPEAMIAAGIGPTFDNGEFLDVFETYEVVNCVTSPPDITRRVQYGCQGDRDCQEKPDGAFITTGLNFELVAPDLTVFSIGSTSPACYVDERTTATIRIRNDGTAPTESIRFRLSTGDNRGMAIDRNGISVDSAGTAFTNILTTTGIGGPSCAGPGALRLLDVELNEINLAVGEFVDVTYELFTSCDCNFQDIRNKYYNRFQLRSYSNPCGDFLNEFRNVDPNGRFDAYIRGLPEGPSTLAGGDGGCFDYFVTAMELDWLRSSYPDAYLEVTFDIPCGLDYQPGTFEWRDRDGTVYPLDESDAEVFTYVDNNTIGAEDQLRVRFKSTDRPGGFGYGGGNNFSFCTVADCDEKPTGACGNAFFDEVIEARFDFTTDDSCPETCVIQNIWTPQPLPIRLVCPNEDPRCECDGIDFTNLEIERTNFGIGDSNNDQRPDGELDPDLVEKTRFLAGDSLRLTLEGFVQDVDASEVLTNGYVIVPIGHSEFTPLGASVSITRAGTGVTETCGAVPITPDYGNNTIRLDISPGVLNGLGCGFSGGDTYGDLDSISVTLDYTEKFQLTSQFRVVTYSPSFYVSTAPFDQGPRLQCNPRQSRMTQVGLGEFESQRLRNFGSCEQPAYAMFFSRFVGGRTLDEFPFEIRPIALPETFTFTKPPEFDHRLASWDFNLTQRIAPANTIVDSRRGGLNGIPLQYFVVNGDEVTLLLGDFLRTQNTPEIPPDEGFELLVLPTIQGNCQSVVGTYQYSFSLTESVDESIFCTSEITRPTTTSSTTYQGAAEIQVTTDQASIRLCSGNDRAIVRVRNVLNPTATNAFLYPEPTGEVVITKIEDAGNGREIVPNEFGVYPLGNIPGIQERVLNVFFTKNTCDDAALSFVGGWDCNDIPETINDALCADPSRIMLTSAQSAVDMLVREPQRNSTAVIALCEPVVFETDILSSDLGFVRDIFLNFSLPPNNTYDPGSFQIAVPAIDQGGTYRTVADPIALGGNRFEIDLSSLDETLNTEGLIGAKDVTRNKISVRFTASTGCGYFSGERVRFSLAANNSCADPLPVVTRESGQIRTGEINQDIEIVVEPIELGFNACSAQPQTVGAVATIGGDLTAVDSIRMLLPPGIDYIDGSYVPGVNAPMGVDPTVVRDADGQTSLILPLATLQDGGNQIAFDVDVIANDIGQLCQSYQIRVDAYSGSIAECNGMVCDIAEIRGSAVAEAVINKPDFDFADISGSIVLDATTGLATGDFSVDIVNQGFPLEAGNTIQVNIYDDTNGNGTFDPGVDQFLFPIDSTIGQDLGTGESTTVAGVSTFPATSICTIIAVIEPSSTCACTTVPSGTFRPEIEIEFQQEYEVCSGDPLPIGLDPVSGYDYRWLPRGGSDITALSATNVPMPVFTAPLNTTGAPLAIEYTVRISNAPCFTDKVVRINVAPLINEELTVQACLGSSFELPTVDTVGKSGFQWTPTEGLTIGPDGRTATVDNVTESTQYALTYSAGVGCNAALIVNIVATDCGTTNTRVGDFVWFDFNMDGIQDPSEPGVEGVQVNLLSGANGGLISSTTTGPDGEYLFDELPSGSYIIEVLPLPGFVFTTMGSGGDEGLDSNVDPATGQTPARFVLLDDADLSFDAGLIPDCTLELDVVVDGCAPGMGMLERQLTVTATWTGNPYAYDQFGDGMDVLDVTIAGDTYTVAIDDVSGTVTVIDSLISPDVTTDYTITGAFRESTSCTDQVIAPSFEPCIYDLALVKMPSTLNPTPPPYGTGDVICYDITVVNQGRQPVENVQVLDLLPTGLAYNATNSDLGWSSVGDRQLYIFPERIAAGADATVTLCANLVPTAGGPDAYTNRAEIVSFTDTLSIVLSDFDEDSTPDQDFTNDPGGVPDSPTDDILDGDGITDEDDSDPARITVYDLALEKTFIEPATPITSGDVITFQIEVFNQGNVPASGIQITDYIPDGMSLAPTSQPTWSAPASGPGGSTLSTTTLAGPIAPGASETVTIGILFEGIYAQTDYVNRAEISGDDGDDVDSQPDQNPTNDPGGLVESVTDGSLLGDGTGTPGAADPATDEDDADPAIVRIEFVGVGSTVFIDADDNARQDATDEGVAGVTLQLFSDVNRDGVLTGDELTPVATTTTGPDGAYLFSEAVPGDYQVQIPASNFAGPLVNFGTSSTNIGTSGNETTDGDDNGTQTAYNGVVTSNFFSLAVGEEPVNEPGSNGDLEAGAGLPDANGNLTIDFGFLPNVAIGSTVFLDPNDNALQDAGETGIPGVTLQLFFDADDNGAIDGAETAPVATTTTDGDGNYLFENLQPGRYQVAIPVSNFSAGGGLSMSVTSSTLIAGSANDNRRDGDDNGAQAGPATVVTSPIIELIPSEEPTGTEEDETGGDQDDIFDASGDMTVDFGFLPNVSIGSTVFLDPNDNGMLDAGENGILGVTVQLFFDADGDGALTGAEAAPIRSVVTGADGNYLFDNLVPGNYQVQIPTSNFAPGGGLNTAVTSSTVISGSATDNRVDNDDNGQQTAPGGLVVSPFIDLYPTEEPVDGAGTNDESGPGSALDNALDSYGDMTVDFGFLPNVSIGSTVFLDEDDNGMLDPGEVGLPGVIIELYLDADENGVLEGAELTPVAGATTDADGNYFFGNLTPGDYQVQLPASNFAPGGPLSGSIASSTVIPGSATDNQVDNDDNGQQDAPGEVVSSAFITLFPATEPTDGAGPNDESGLGANPDDPFDASGDMTIDFGFLPNVSLGSTIFLDPNDNGMLDPGETGIPGVVVELYFDIDENLVLEGDELTPLATTVTDADGNYFFDDLAPGDYQVQIPASNFAPTGGLSEAFTSSTVIPGSATDNQVDNDDNGQQPGGASTLVTSPFITLFPATEPTNGTGPNEESGPGSNQDDTFDANGDMTVDFGFLPNVSLGSTVFLDADNNALLDPGETGISGVILQLLFDENGDGTRTVVATTMTNADGNYLFDNLTPGDYQIRIPENNFTSGTLSTALLSSDDRIDMGADAGAMNVDNDDNGDQPGGFGTEVLSPVINLTPAEESTGEPGPGGDQDDLYDASGDMTVDFGFAPNGSLGSTVFVDADNDGMQAATEMGIPDVVLDLYFDADGNGVLEGAELTPVATETTDADGNYFFDNLAPGDYQIQIPVSNFAAGGGLDMNTTSSIPTSTVDDETDGDDNGTQAGDGMLVTSPFITLYPGDEPAGAEEDAPGGDQDDTFDLVGDMTVDFGFLPNGSLGSTVFLDANNNALLDGGETGIAGVTLQLLFDADSSGVIDPAEETPIQTTMTDADGNYLFSNLMPGNYQVVIPATNFADGAGLGETLLSSNDALDVNADAGTANIDDDDNGDQPGGFGTEVRSPLVNIVPATEITGEPGQGGDQDAAFDSSGDMTIDFGFAPNVSLGSAVFLDQDDNGLYDATEMGLAGVTVELYFDADGNGVLEGAELTAVETTVTDADGNYYFDNLPPGDYQVQLPPANFGGSLSMSLTSSTDVATTDGDNQTDGDDNGLQPGGPGAVITSPFITLYPAAEPTGGEESGPGGDQDDVFDSSGDMTLDFGLLPNVAIGSTVFFDPNNNAVLDAGETGIAGVSVELYFDADGNGTIDGTEGDAPAATTLTDADGNYLFSNLVPGNYQVQIPATNFADGSPLDTTLLSSNDDLDVNADAGDMNIDNDDNGDQPGGFGTVVSSPVVTLTPGLEPVGTESGTGADQDAAFDVSGDMTIDFGFAPNVSLGSAVFLDADNDGMQGAAETGLADVLIELYFDADGDGMLTGAELTPVATQTTAADGTYYFDNLPPGNYQVQIPASNFDVGGALENNFTSSIPTSTVDDETDGDDNGIQAGASMVVTSPFVNLYPASEPVGGEETGPGSDQDDIFDSSGDMTLDFGFLPNVAIGSTVFFDPNNNALLDAGETGIAGVTVQLLFDADSSGTIDPAEETPLLTTTTDADGNYLFDNLTPGNYQVLIPATNFADGSPLDTTLLSSNDAIDVDADAGAANVDNDDNGDQPGGFGTEVRSPVINLFPAGEPEGELAPGGDQDAAFDSSGDMSIDFGFAPNVSLGSAVFLDQDDNGLYDATEMGLAGVTVELYFDADGNGVLEGAELTAVESTVTDADGNYYFDNLPPGDYQVQLPAANFGGSLAMSLTSSTDVATTGGDNQTDGDDNGLQPGGPGAVITSPFITLYPAAEPTGGEESGPGGDQDDVFDSSGDMTLDFGLLPNVAIGSTVFFDPNNNALLDAGETGIAGVTVELYFDADGNGAIDGTEGDAPAATTLTDADGNYLFSNLVPGNYQVQIPATNFADGSPLDTTLLSSNDDLDVNADAGDMNIDNDDNGDQPGGFGTVVSSPVVTLTPGLEPVGTESGTGADQDAAFDVSGDMTIDFGFAPNVSLGSAVFLDADNDGMQGAAETGLADVLIELYFDADGDGMLTGAELTPVATQTTAADGTYYFDNLPPGDYQVQIPASNFDVGGALENNFTSSIPTSTADDQTDGDDNGIQAGASMVVTSPFVNLYPASEPVGGEETGPGSEQDDIFDASGDMTLDFGFLPNVAIGSTVFFDPNNNALLDAGETGIAGVTVQLLFDADSSGTIDPAEETPLLSTTTDADGNYLFENLTPGNYQVVIPASNFADGSPLDTTLLSSNDAIDVDADAGAANVDNDDNGDQPGGFGTEVRSPVINLFPASESVGELAPGGDQDAAFDSSGDMTIDFGFAPNVSLGSGIFLDANNDGIRDPSEGGLADVLVELYFDADGNGVLEGDELTPVATQLTDAQGTYYFDNLPPGDYQVQIPASNFAPGGALENSFTSSIPTSTADDQTEGDDNGIQSGASMVVTSPFVNLYPGDEPVDPAESGPGGDRDNVFDSSGDMTLDFGFLPNVAIGSTVFFDPNNNALLDAGETGISGVTVQLLFDADSSGTIEPAEETPVLTTTTDADGNYLFANLTPGNYQVVIPATNFADGSPLDTALLSSNDVLDVDVDAGAANIDNDDNGSQPGGFGTEVRSPIINLAPASAPVNELPPGGDQDDAFDSSGDMTIDFGFAPNVSLGSTVFLDQNDNALYDGTEAGLPLVTVELYFDADANGMLEGAELTPVATTVTDADGNYFFENLPPGDYQLQLPATNFAAGGPLASSLTSSTDSATSGADNDVDGDDNGQQTGGPGTVISTPFFNLYPAAEPTDATETSPGGDQDAIFDTSGNMTLDFGLLPNVAIGSTVFFDTENDGLLNGPDTGIEGVTVQLLFDADADGTIAGAEETPIATMTTDADGNYLFSNLVPGNYQLLLPVDNFTTGPLDTALASSSPDVDNDLDSRIDNDDNGQQPGGFGTEVRSPIITLTPGLEPVAEESGAGADQDVAFDVSGDMTVDFGFVPNVSIGSTVFIDPNDNALFDAGEIGLVDVVVELYFDADGNGVLEGGETTAVATTTTDGDGLYYFDNLPPGSYQVQIPEDNFPDVGGLRDAFTSSTNITTSDADNQVDDDDNGLQPAGAGTRVFSPFINLEAGREPTDATETGAGGAQDAIFDTSGDMTVDFGFLPNVAVGSTVFRDLNNNGVQDLGEFGIAGVTMEIYLDADEDGLLSGAETTPVRTILTDGDGNYIFTILVPGVYQVQIPPSNYADGAALDTFPNSSNDIATTAIDNQVDGDDNGLQVVSGGRVVSPFIDLRSGQEPTTGETGQGGDLDDGFDLSGDMTVDFGFTPNVSIGSTVFIDPNDNGLQDNDEMGIPGVVLALFLDADTSGVLDGAELTPIAFDTTDANGNYFFGDLIPGNYQVEIPGGNFPGMSGLSQSFTSSTDRSGQTGADNNIDGDDNGTQPGGPGMTVLAPFVFLEPGDEPAGATEFAQGGDQDDEFDAYGNMTIDFGFLPNTAVGSTVFFDQNNNGLQDAGEAGIEGVTVEIYLDANRDGVIAGAEDSPIRTVMTDAEGNYLFSILVPGDYEIRIPTSNFTGVLEELPNSSIDIATSTADNQVDGDDNGLQELSGGVVRSPIIVLRSGSEPVEEETEQGADLDTEFDLSGDMTVDFGFTPNVSLGSSLFVDVNDNGVRDEEDPGIPGVLLQLYRDLDGNGLITDDEREFPFDQTVSDADGDYYFGNLPPGNYIVEIPTVNFAPGSPLEFLPGPSTTVAATIGDNQIDDDNNGIQQGGPGSAVRSPIITLTPGREPTGMAEDDGGGGTQDDLFDNAGDMTVDFGFLCNLAIVNVTDRTVCSTKDVDLRNNPTIIPDNVGGTYTTTGDGVFLDVNKQALAEPFRHGEVAYYRPGPGDIRSGELTITLMTDAAGLCVPVEESFRVTVLEVDCGGFFWDGNRP